MDIATAEIEPAVRGGGVNAIAPIPCPCCAQPVNVPTLEIVIMHCKLTQLEARILRVIWKARGSPVHVERVFDAMYEDDPDGGPPYKKMYDAFKVALCHLRAKLKGTGIGIANYGYRRGYRLTIGE